MATVRDPGRIILTALGVALFSSVGFGQTLPPLRGVYPLGMNSINSGVTPESGFSYSNLFLFYSRNQLKGSSGEVVSTGNNSVLMDLNTIVWVSQKKILGGARLSLTATLLVNNNSLTSDVVGPISGGGGFGDSYYQPFILGWENDRAAIRAVYGFLAPTGKFTAGTNDNVGSGYWVSTLFFGPNVLPYQVEIISAITRPQFGSQISLGLFNHLTYHPCQFNTSQLNWLTGDRRQRTISA